MAKPKRSGNKAKREWELAAIDLAVPRSNQAWRVWGPGSAFGRDLRGMRDEAEARAQYRLYCVVLAKQARREAARAKARRDAAAYEKWRASRLVVGAGLAWKDLSC